MLVAQGRCEVWGMVILILVGEAQGMKDSVREGNKGQGHISLGTVEVWDLL